MVFQLDFKGPYRNIRMSLLEWPWKSVICMDYLCILAAFQSKMVRRSEVILG